MIGLITLHYEDKSRLEEFILQSKSSMDNISMTQDIINDKVRYPLISSQNLIEYRVDQYKGYVQLNLRRYYSDEFNRKYIQEFNYSHLCMCIEILTKNIVDIERTTLSKLSIVLYLKVEMPPKKLINSCILMHNLNNYNHNLSPNYKGTLKQFEYHNYVLGVYSLDGSETHLKIALRYKKSAEYRKLGIRKIVDLMDKTNLSRLYNNFLRRFDELTIIDNESSATICNSDKKKLLEYSNPIFWKKLDNSGNRRVKTYHKRKFELLQIKYNLNTLKTSLANSIIQNINQFLDIYISRKCYN